MSARPASPPLPERVQSYLDAIVRTCAGDDTALVSIILFGSAATGGFTGAVSDVDLMLVLPDGATPDERRRVRETVVNLELAHGFGVHANRSQGAIESIVERITANGRSYFICTRQDLLSADPARILGISQAQALFVDRIVIPSMLAFAATAWGEELLTQIPFPPIRRFDVFKAFFGLFSQVVTSACWFPVLPGATKFAMGALKRSVHNCYFCYQGRPAKLDEEIAYFRGRLGRIPTLEQLLELRREYRDSFGFVLRCLATLVRLHWRTALDNRFPRPAVRPRGATA